MLPAKHDATTARSGGTSSMRTSSNPCTTLTTTWSGVTPKKRESALLVPLDATAPRRADAFWTNSTTPVKLGCKEKKSVLN